jgi:hypothetical protein
MGDLSAVQFDANAWDTEPQEYTPIDDGSYNCVLDLAEVESNEKGTKVTLQVQIIDSGKFMNRRTKVWLYLAGHANAKYQDRCSKQFAALCKAVGVFNPQDTTEIIAKPFTCDIKSTKGDDGTSWTQCSNFRKSEMKAEPEATPF